MEEGGIFRPFLSTHLSVAAQRKEQKEIAEISRHPMLTEKLAEVQFRIHHSGFWIGKHKCNTKRGDTSTCMECGEEENVIHTFCDCLKINTLWRKVFKWWRRRTSEVVKVTPKETLLGLRPDRDSLSFKELVLPFTYLRTQTISAIKNERTRRRNGVPARTVMQMFQNILKAVQKNANSLYIAACTWDKWHPPVKDKWKVHPRSLEAFKETWIQSGIAKITQSRSLPVILRARGH